MFVALVIQHAMRMSHIVVCGLYGCTVLFHDTILEKKLFDRKCVFWFPLQLLSEIFLILRKVGRDMVKMYIGLHVKYPCQILMKLEFSRQIFLKTLKYQILWKSVQWEQSCSIRTDRPIDGHDEANSRFFFSILRMPIKRINKNKKVILICAQV